MYRFLKKKMKLNILQSTKFMKPSYHITFARWARIFSQRQKKYFSLLMKVELRDAEVAKQSQKPFSKSLCVEEDRHGDSSSRL